MMICLADAAVVGNLRVYERNISVVGLGLRVDKREDTLSARHCKHYRVYLLRDLIDISRELLGHAHKRHEHVDGKNTDARRYRADTDIRQTR